jgi:hypothetical protein
MMYAQENLESKKGLCHGEEVFHDGSRGGADFNDIVVC